MTDNGLEEDDVESGQKLDRIDNTMTELRVTQASMNGKLDAMLSRLDGHDNRGEDVERRLRAVETVAAVAPADVETRLRSLEGRSRSIPSMAAILSLVGLALALWATFHQH